MKANKFVEKFGINEAKRIIPICEKQGAGLTVSGYRVNLDDLKRLVESYELVMEFGDDASYLKEHLLRNPTIKEFYLDSWCRTFSVVRLKQAIADVESCQ